VLAGGGMFDTITADGAESVVALQVERTAVLGGPAFSLSFRIPLPQNWTGWGASGVQLRTRLSAWGAGAGTTATAFVSLRSPTGLGGGTTQQTLTRVEPATDAGFVDLGISQAQLNGTAGFVPGRLLYFDVFLSNTVGGTANPIWQFSRLTVDWL
jgi:hypothetical protein